MMDEAICHNMLFEKNMIMNRTRQALTTSPAEPSRVLEEDKTTTKTSKQLRKKKRKKEGYKIHNAHTANKTQIS